MPRIEIFHNLDRDASFGLNVVFCRKDPGGYVKEIQDRSHGLVKVFEFDTEWTDDRASVDPLLNKVYRLFNVGDDPAFGTPAPVALAYRARRLRSLSKGDVVKIDGDAYALDSFWESVSNDDLNVLDAAEAERVVRERFDFGAAEQLALSVPWEA